MQMSKKENLIPVERIEQSIFVIRSQKVMLDTDLAVLYAVETKVLNQAVKRNERRFPPDFAFRLTKNEKDELVTNCDRLSRLKHSSALPRAFTEQGVVDHRRKSKPKTPIKNTPHPNEGAQVH